MADPTDMSPGAYEFNADEEKAMRTFGKAVLKSHMAGVYDADGKEHPDSPHYSESQDATTSVSKAVRPDLSGK